MNNPLVRAFENGSFDATQVAGMSHSKINAATRWAVVNNKASLLRFLRPHSKYKTRGGVHPLMCAALEQGSFDIIEMLSSEMSAETVLHNNGALIAAAYSSSSVVGAKWLIGKRSALGLNNDVFAHALRQNCLSAHSNVVDYLAKTFPQQRFEWFHMAQTSAENNDAQRCILFLKHAHRSKIYTPKQLVRVLYAVAQHVQPQSFEKIFAAATTLYGGALEGVVNLSHLFKLAVERQEGTTHAVGALVQQFGAHVDCRSLGQDMVETIEFHKANYLNNTISCALPDSEINRSVRKL